MQAPQRITLRRLLFSQSCSMIPGRASFSADQRMISVPSVTEIVAGTPVNSLLTPMG